MTTEEELTAEFRARSASSNPTAAAIQAIRKDERDKIAAEFKNGLRLQAALAALQGLCASSPRLTDHPETLASRAFSVADAFLAEAQKEGQS